MIPDLTKAVIGFRTWGIEGNCLHAFYSNHCWRAGVNRAYCYSKKHEAPQEFCECSFYAYHESRECIEAEGGRKPDYVLGAVKLWGRVEVHNLGARAQFAEPLMLASFEVHTAYQSSQLEAVAEKYQLEIADIEELEERCLAYGAPIPVSMRPQAPRLLNPGPDHYH